MSRQQPGRNSVLSLGFEPLRICSFSYSSPRRAGQAAAGPHRTLRALRHLRSVGIGATLVLLGTTSLQNAVANGDTRTLTFHHTHSGEDGTFTFKKDGRYDPAVLEKLNYFLRDWRNQKQTKMDPHLFDIVWEVYRETDAKAPIQIVSSFRSPETNALLRSRSNGVAKFSQHMLGKAMDFYIPGVQLSDLRVAGLRLQRGGVGFYPTSGSPFVHMDTGNVRHWPRMTHDQLARVFPDGKTVHVPSDGRPLAHYNEALAEIRSRSSDAGVAVASAGSGKNFLSKLFGKKDDDEESGAAETTVAAADDEAGAPRTEASNSAAPASASPLPAPRPGETAAGALATAQIASAPLPAMPLPRQRPGELAQSLTAVGSRTQVASLAGVPLPSVITRGTGETAGGRAQTRATALGYASAGDPRDLSEDVRIATSGAVEDESDRPPSAVGALARLRGRDGGAAPLPARAPQQVAHRASQPTAKQIAQQTAEARITFGRLFLAPSLDGALFLREPELRIFAGFVTAPREVVAYNFSQDASFGLKTGRFAGPAVAELPTYVFRAQAFAQRL